MIRGHPKKSVLQTKALRELGLFALCSEAQNILSYRAFGRKSKKTFMLLSPPVSHVATDICELVGDDYA